MKKRILITALLVVLLAVPAFAASSRIGATAGFTVDYTKITLENDSNKASRWYTSYAIDGASYFTRSVGVGYGIQLNYPTVAISNKTAYLSTDTVYPFLGTNVTPYLEFLYAFNLADNLAFELGAGASANIMFKTYEGAKLRTYRFNGVITLGFAVDLGTHCAVVFGEKITIPAYTLATLGTEKLTIKDYGVSGTSYAGISYTY